MQGLFPDADEECSLCLEEFCGDGLVQTLPQCTHIFHMECVHDWLARNATCPKCREPIPDRIPRPPSFQERRLAKRLELTRAGWRKPLSVKAGIFSGAYNPCVQLLYELSERQDFAGEGNHTILILNVNHLCSDTQFWLWQVAACAWQPTRPCRTWRLPPPLQAALLSSQPKMVVKYHQFDAVALSLKVQLVCAMAPMVHFW